LFRVEVGPRNRLFDTTFALLPHTLTPRLIGQLGECKGLK